MMTKNVLFAATLLSLALATSCATGGRGPCGGDTCPQIVVSASSNGINNVSEAGVGMTMTFTATFKYATQGPVNWSLTGTSCSSSDTDPSNPCGYFTSTTSSTANYQGPAAVPSTPTFTVTATAQSDGSLSGDETVTILEELGNVTPVTTQVGLGLTQQYVATATPDQSPQTFTWSCMAGGSACQNFSWTKSVNGSYNGVATYTPVAAEECGSGCVVIEASALIDSGVCTGSQNPCNATTVVASRVSGSYAFKFSGFDTNGKPVSAIGSFTADSSGNISSGVEDELTASGSHTSIAITGGSYTPITASNPNSNNAGTLTLLPAGAYPYKFQVVLDGAGDVQMIEADSNGTGSGIAEVSSKNKFNTTNATYAFGFTGVDASETRIGYAGILPTVPSSTCSGGAPSCGTITGGLMDVNDGGNASNSICAASVAPCTVAGSYTEDLTYPSLWHLNLASPIPMTFDFFVGNGSTGSNNPLNLYAISTDTNPSVLGTMTLQNSKLTYNNAAQNGTAVSVLTGANNNVALILGSTDGSSSATGSGNCPNNNGGNFTGNFDQNNAGTILTVSAFPSAAQTTNPYTYVATNSNTGRYIFCMLGNPGASPVGAPIPFVFYASGADQGYLLDESSSSVLTGSMVVQNGPKQNDEIFTSSGATGTYALTTNSNAVSSITPLAMNLLFTSPGTSVFNVTGTQNPKSQSVTGTYTVNASGTGTVTLTAPAAANYIIYGIAETDFFAITENSGTSSPIFYMAQ